MSEANLNGYTMCGVLKRIWVFFLGVPFSSLIYLTMQTYKEHELFFSRCTKNSEIKDTIITTRRKGLTWIHYPNSYQNLASHNHFDKLHITSNPLKNILKCQNMDYCKTTQSSNTLNQIFKRGFIALFTFGQSVAFEVTG